MYGFYPSVSTPFRPQNELVAIKKGASRDTLSNLLPKDLRDVRQQSV